MSFPRYERYKDSGVEWLGEVPEGWTAGRFSRVIHAIKDGTHGTFARMPEGRPLLSAKNVQDGRIVISDEESLISEQDHDSIVSNGFPRSGDLLLTIVGTIGRSCVYSFSAPISFQRSVCFIRCIDDVSSKFLYYLTQSKVFQEQLISRSKSAAQGGVYMGDVCALSIVYPNNFIEQQTIAAFLDRETAKIDVLIAEQKRLIELLKEKRQAVISHAVTKGLNPAAPMKDSGVEWLGEVPEHWEVKKIKHLSSRISSGKTPLGGSEVYVDEGITFLRSQNVYDEGLRLDDVVFITAAIDEAMAVSRVIPNDILLNITGASIGRSCVIPSNFPPANVNQHVCVIRLEKTSQVLFVGWYFKSTTIKNQIDHAQNGAAREGLNFVQIGELSISLPPRAEQEKIASFLDRETAKLDTLTAEAQAGITLLQERRTALISAAVTGKIDVRGLSAAHPQREVAA